jgi:capsid assembly protease
MLKTGMLAAVAMAAGLGAEQANSFVLSAETLAQHFPDLAAAVKQQGFADGKAEGAKAERERITGIEAASMPGHEAIIAAHKADASKTPADAAMAVITAEKAVMGTRKSSLQADEEKLAGLKAAAAPVAAAATGVITNDNAHDMGRRARDYRAAQAKLGNKLTPEQALAHITAQEG